MSRLQGFPEYPNLRDVEGLIIDAVGTLIEPTPSVAEVYAGVARSQGLQVDPRAVRAKFRKCFQDEEDAEAEGPLQTDEGREQQRWRRIVAHVLPDLPDFEHGFEELWDHFGRPDAWRCFTDVGPALQALEAAGKRIRIASNFDARLRSVARGMAELSNWAESLVISSEVGYRKPHRVFFQRACASLGLPPDLVLCVGDNPENDHAGARAARLRSVLIDRDNRAPRDLPCLPNLTALVAIMLS